MARKRDLSPRGRSDHQDAAKDRARIRGHSPGIMGKWFSPQYGHCPRRGCVMLFWRSMLARACLAETIDALSRTQDATSDWAPHGALHLPLVNAFAWGGVLDWAVLRDAQPGPRAPLRAAINVWVSGDRTCPSRGDEKWARPVRSGRNIPTAMERARHGKRRIPIATISGRAPRTEATPTRYHGSYSRASRPRSLHFHKDAQEPRLRSLSGCIAVRRGADLSHARSGPACGPLALLANPQHGLTSMPREADVGSVAGCDPRKVPVPTFACPAGRLWTMWYSYPVPRRRG